MEYRISKYVGWFLLTVSLWLVLLNYTNPACYFILFYCFIWVILTSSRSYTFRYQKRMLLCLQSIAVISLGYSVLERSLFVFRNKSLEGEHGEGSPLMFLIGGGIELVVFSVLLVSFIEVIRKKINLDNSSCSV
jgi:hypothetical protein